VPRAVRDWYLFSRLWCQESERWPSAIRSDWIRVLPRSTKRRRVDIERGLGSVVEGAGWSRPAKVDLIGMFGVVPVEY
jgi:hypothetical protein